MTDVFVRNALAECWAWLPGRFRGRNRAAEPWAGLSLVALMSAG